MSKHHLVKQLVKKTYFYKLYKNTAGVTIKKNDDISFDSYTSNAEFISTNKNNKYSKVAIVACFTKNGFLPNYLIEYLKSLKKYFDGVILVGDCPIFKSELVKIEGMVMYASFSRHKEYDFGSYKRGYLYLKSHNLLNDISELLLTNDSCFGPINSLSTIFKKMNKQNCDFWGLIENNDIRTHLQSWFILLKHNVIVSDALNIFLSAVEQQKKNWDVVTQYETRFTHHLVKNGFKYSAYLQASAKIENKTDASSNLTFYPLDLIKKYDFPFIKIKVFSDYKNYIDQRIILMNYLQKNNYKYYTLIKDYLVTNNFDTLFMPLTENSEFYYSNLSKQQLINQIKGKDFQIKKMEAEKYTILNGRRYRLGCFIANCFNGLKRFITIKNKNNYGKIKNKLPYYSIYQNNIDFSKYNTDIKALAFYLPQFHSFKENDEWWGKGFTEWTNTKKSKPRFKGHYQPRLPHRDIGYYDLSDYHTILRQAKLAKQHGIYGFIFYYYWFSGKELMEKPINLLIQHPEIELPFCLCWANENWTRTWDGMNDNVLIAQKYSQNDPNFFIQQIKKYISDKRYIKINGKPLILIYNPYEIPNINFVISQWRIEAKQQGLGEIYVVVRKLMFSKDPTIYNADAEFDFPPVNHAIRDSNICYTKELHMFDYSSSVSEICNQMKTMHSDKPFYYTSTMGWDNTSRRKNKCFVFFNYNLESFYNWNTQIINNFDKSNNKEKLLLINAWNEWCEGTYLEPDEKYGYANINTLSKAIYRIPYNEVSIYNSKTKYNLKNKKIAVHIHLFHLDLIDEVIEQINFMPYEFDCFISTDCEDKKNKIEQSFKNRAHARNIIVSICPNRGRDVAPFIMQMRPHYKNYDYICHIHTKKTKFASYGNDWRNYLYKNLFGNAGNIACIFKTFEENSHIGIVYPPTFYKVTGQVTGYNGNYDLCKKICRRLGIPIQYLNEKLVFPSGTMFWAKTDAIKPIFSSKIKLRHFAKENNQTNVTYAHAIERILTTVAISQGYTYKNTLNKN